MRIFGRLSPVAKAVTAAVIGAVVPLVTVGLTHGFDWKAILAAGLTSGAAALSVYLVPNRPGKLAARRSRRVRS